MWPDATYIEALHNARLISLSERRSDACVKFVMGKREGNPLFPLVYNRVVKSTQGAPWPTAQYTLRWKIKKQATPVLFGRTGLPIL